MEKYTTVNVRQIKKRNNQWQARAKYKDTNGKWSEVSKMLPEAKGKRSAEKMAEDWRRELNAQAEQIPEVKNIDTVEEVYLDYIYQQMTRGEIEKSTYSNSIQTFRTYVKPYLGNYIFASVDKTVLSGWIEKLYNLGLSQNTIHVIYSRLKKVFTFYYNSGELLKDPFNGIKMPKKGDPKVTHLTDEQVDKILSAVYSLEPEEPMYVGILLALYTGLRRGEICGLRWNDIDFVKQTITVRTAVGVSSVDVEGSGNYTKNPKNKSSYRTFPMIPPIERALKERKDRIKPENNWFVVGNKDQFMSPNLYNRLFSRFVKDNNLVDAYGNKLVPHALRHNFATFGIRSGMDIASLSLMMGHASRAMTLDTYGDANADALILARDKLGDLFKETSIIEQDISDALDEIKSKE